MVKWNNCLLILFLCLGPILARGQSLIEANVLYLSSSEESLALDRGELDKFNEGEIGRIFIQRGEVNTPKLFLIGEGRIVKSYPNKSLFFMSKLFIKHQLKMASPVLVLLAKNAGNGRGTVLREKSIIYREDEYDSADDYLSHNKNLLPDSMLHNGGQSIDNVIEMLHDENEKTDLTLTRLGPFSKKDGDRYNEDVNEAVTAYSFLQNKKYELMDVKKSENLKILTSDSRALLKKYNSLKYGLKGELYLAQEKQEGNRELNKRILTDSLYDEVKLKNREHTQLDPRAVAKIQRDGEMWSADMDDETLRKYFVTSGILSEKERRQNISNELDGNEFSFSFLSNMNGHTTAMAINDGNQALGYYLNFAYSLHFSRTTFNLKDVTMDFVFEKGMNNYDINGMNGHSDETIFGAFLNYYFWNNPLTLGQFSLLAGMGIKYGSSTMSSSLLSKSYDYQIQVRPAFQLMTKYRFRVNELNEKTANVGLAVNFGVEMEQKELRIVNIPSDNIKATLSVSEMKYLAGVSFYF